MLRYFYKLFLPYKEHGEVSSSLVYLVVQEYHKVGKIFNKGSCRLTIFRHVGIPYLKTTVLI